MGGIFKRASIAFGLVVAVAGPAFAAGKVYSPSVEPGEFEVENRGTQADDGAMEMKTGFGYGFTKNWFAEVYGVAERAPGGQMDLKAVEFENLFQITPTGAYWADLGFIAEYSADVTGGAPDELEFGPLIEKQIGRTVHTANLVFVKEIGDQAQSFELEYAWASRWRVASWFEPGFEAFGKLGELKDTGPLRNQEHQIGPAIVGRLPFNIGPGKIRYETGYYFGLTDGAPDGEFRWLLEYELRF